MDFKIDNATIYFEGLLTLKQVSPKVIEKDINKITDEIKYLDISKIESIDTAGAYFILKIANNLKTKRLHASRNPNHCAAADVSQTEL